MGNVQISPIKSFDGYSTIFPCKNPRDKTLTFEFTTVKRKIFVVGTLACSNEDSTLIIKTSDVQIKIGEVFKLTLVIVEGSNLDTNLTIVGFGVFFQLRR